MTGRAFARSSKTGRTGGCGFGRKITFRAVMRSAMPLTGQPLANRIRRPQKKTFATSQVCISFGKGSKCEKHLRRGHGTAPWISHRQPTDGERRRSRKRRLCHVEDRVGAEHRDRALFFFVADRELLGEDDDRAALSAANLCAGRSRDRVLAETAWSVAQWHRVDRHRAARRLPFYRHRRDAGGSGEYRRAIVGACADDRRPAIRQSQRRYGAAVFRRWPCRGQRGMQAPRNRQGLASRIEAAGLPGGGGQCAPSRAEMRAEFHRSTLPFHGVGKTSGHEVAMAACRTMGCIIAHSPRG